jgi:polar amino acid transport system ATP-binding protein
MSLLVNCEGVIKRFGSLAVLNGLDFQLKEGEKLAVIGRSGSGKSTLLRVLMTLETIDSGRVDIDSQTLWEPSPDGTCSRMNDAGLRQIRSKLGMVFQQFNLFPHMTALENVALAPRLSGLLSAGAARERAKELLERVGLSPKLDAYPAEMSGGQQQRVAIARALAMRPKIMLFDEVTSALDPELVGEVLGVMRSLAHEHGLAMIIVTHQMGFAREVADRVCFFDSGRIMEEGPPDIVLSSPRHESTRAFLKAVVEV